MRRAVLIAVATWGCRADVGFDGTAYRCEDGVSCPAGYQCMASMCVRMASPPDAPPGAADARPPDGTPPQADGPVVTIDGAADAPPATYRDVVLADTPILYLTLDDTDTTAIDSSGHGRDGTYVGGVVHVSGAAQFDGVDDAILVGDEEALRLNGSFTIEVWLKLVALVNTYPGIIYKGDAEPGGTGYIVYYPLTTSEPVFKRAGVDVRDTEGAPVTTDRFRHYVVTYDAGTGTLTWYVDGVLNQAYSSISYATNVDASDLAIGRADEYGNQLLDEVAFYDHALSPVRVAEHFAAR